MRTQQQYDTNLACGGCIVIGAFLALIGLLAVVVGLWRWAL